MAEKDINETSVINSDFGSILDQLLNLQTQLKNMVSVVKKLEKNVNKEINQSKKTKKKSKEKKPRTPSGFAKPKLISPELCKLLDKASGTETARTEVTKNICQYIKNNELQN